MNFQYILPTVEKQRSFVLVGYSFGSLLAIELARRLEKHGLTGRLVLIDGTPDLIKAMIEQYLSFSTQEELQNNVLLSIINTLQPNFTAKVSFIIFTTKLFLQNKIFDIFCSC